MDAPRMTKDVQKLTGCMAALNRFISRLWERDYPSSNGSSSIKSSSGPRRQTRHCKISSTSRQPSGRLPNQTKTCYSISRWLLMLLVRQSWWNDRRKARLLGAVTSLLHQRSSL
jgi:hypothetical protein